MTAASNKRDIAIVGMSGRFAESPDLKSFWNNLANDKELVQFHKETDKESETYINASARLSNTEYFDFAFFGYTKKEAEMMDPQIRILHEEVYLALEDAGFQSETNKEKVGCFLSGSDNLNWRAHTMINTSEEVSSFLQEQISDINSVNTLISYALNLQGPSYFLNTACSSSLVAVHIACRNLLLRECSMAVAGGVSIASDTETGYHHHEGMIMSADGHCKPFDSDASGTVNGEGAGVVVLKRMEDAIRDNDHIYAIIKGSATNNDGNRKVGFTAPSIRGQHDCIKLAHKVAGIKSGTIGYLEAHGTGTKLGDPVEVEALNKAFNIDGEKKCALGSVKSNMGHLDGAAGVAGLIKAVLALKNKKIPGSLHYKTPNPEINFGGGPFFVNAQTIDWSSNQLYPRRAGVSSFGIGGTNVHVVLEEAPELNTQSSPRPWHILKISAKTPGALENMKSKYADQLKQEDTSVKELVYTVNTAKTSLKYRAIAYGKNSEELIESISAKNKVVDATRLGNSGNVVFMLPGQGSQCFKMGNELYHSEKYFKEIMDQGLSLLNQITGKDYRTIIGYDHQDTAEKELIHQTIHAQPLLYLFEYALAKTLMHWGIQPKQMIGHSLGEYVAATLAGVWPFEKGLELVVKRAELMWQMPQGSMLAIHAPWNKVKEITTKGLSLAAINTADSCVVSGENEEIEKLKTKLDEREISNKILATSHAFHSHMMEDTLTNLERVIEGMELKKPEIPFVSNLYGRSISDSEATSSIYWSAHLRNTVKFNEGIEWLLKRQESLFVEIGPGKSLSSIVRQNSLFNQPNEIAFLLGTPKEDEQANLSKALGMIWQNGFSINWEAYYQGNKQCKISVAGYAFEPYRVPARVNPLAQLMNLSPQLNASNNSINNWLYEQRWRETENVVQKQDFDLTIALIDDSEVGISLKEFCEKEPSWWSISKGNQWEKIADQEYQVSTKTENFTLLFNEIKKTRAKKVQIIHTWSNNQPENELEIGYYTIQNIVKAFSEVNEIELEILTITSSVFSVLGNENISPERSTLVAALQVAENELEHLTSRIVELEKDQPLNEKQLNLFLNNKNNLLAFRGKKVWEPWYTQRKQGAKTVHSIQENGTYLITGAGGGMGFEIAKYLKSKYETKLILVGRSEPHKKLKDWIEKNSEEVFYCQSNLTDSGSLQKVLGEILEQCGEKLDGVFHCAGLADYDGLIIDRNKEACKAVMTPKVEGTNTIYNAVKSFEPTFILLCSSTSSVLAPLGQIAYTAANLYQNQYAIAHEGNTRMISVAWDTWRESGMAVKSMNRFGQNETVEQLDHGLTNEQGMEILEQVITSEANCLFVSIQGMEAELAFTMEQTVSTPTENELTYQPDLSVSYQAPSNETEKELCTLWQSLFGYEQVGVLDDFFELGGDSLKSMTLIRRIHQVFSIEISLEDFFKMNTIQEIAKEIQLIKELSEIKNSTEVPEKSNQIRL